MKKSENIIFHVLCMLITPLSIIFFLALTICALFLMGFTYMPEHVVVRNDIKMVARVSSFLDEMVYYYQYKNIFFYGKELGDEYYGSGGSDPLAQASVQTPVRWTFYDLDGNVIESDSGDKLYNNAGRSDMDEMDDVNKNDNFYDCSRIYDKEILEKAETRSMELALSYQAMYRNAEKEKSVNRPNQTIISQETIDVIEDFLINQGYSVVNSDSYYPPYLENADGLYAFWQSVSAGKNAEQEFLSIEQTGALYYSLLKYDNGNPYLVNEIIGWDEDCLPVISTSMCRGVLDWDLADDDFYYQIYPDNVSFDSCMLLRLKPVDKEFYELAEKYIFPIAYSNNNMFLCDWSCDNYNDLSFNDLFDFFYRIKNGESVNVQEFERIEAPYHYLCIPSELFEDTIMPYFDITADELRELSLYDSARDIYPWQEINCENVIHYPSVEPEVVKHQINENGTFTLTVNVRCNDFMTDCLFTHEVAIRQLESGGYQYLGNQIVYRSEFELPPNRSRLLNVFQE